MRKKLSVLCLIITFILLFLPLIIFSDIQIVEATHITKRKYSPVLEVNGTIESGETIPVSLSYPVCIKECHISENDYVNKGQLIFTLDLEMMENALKNNYLSEYTEAYSSADKSIFLSMSENIYATESGYISQLTAENGSVILSDENLCVISTGDELLLKITLNQDDYSLVSVGDNVRFSPLIMPSRVYYGKISNKTALIRKENSLTGTKTVVDIYATIQNADDKLVSGLQFSGKILKNSAKSIYTLPYEYINQDENGEFVNIFNNGKITKHYIETGAEELNYTEILTAFDDNTLFIKNNYNGKGNVLLKYDTEQLHLQN
ncbi:MAG: biotin/lipoyl-binding protein [Ruminococcaceae bacterium]|nr:biotin/lipoyl-binding protein [Oscillospiraceae bacterium]